MYKSLEEKTTNFKRRELKKVLLKCTEKQIAFFNRLYGSIETIPKEKMYRAYEQCIATIQKNRKDKNSLIIDKS